MQLLTVTEMAEADRLTIAGGTLGYELMKNAGRAVAEAAADLVEEGLVIVVVGCGNNGGDGFVAAIELSRSGRDVVVMLVGDAASLRGDAAQAATDWKGPVLSGNAEAIREIAAGTALFIDALLGAGLDRPVQGKTLQVIEALNTSGVPILAVDLPSGVHGTTGEVMGNAVCATETITFFRRKPGHFLLPGRMYCGQVRVADIGISPDVLADIRPATFENIPEFWERSFPVPGMDRHKYSRGHAVVVSGSKLSTGAARLAARAALRGGAGLVTVASPSDALAVNAAALTAVMLREVETPTDFATMLSDKRITACVIGPGGGVDERMRSMVLEALRSGSGVVLDADALTVFEDDPDDLFEAINSSKAGVVLTPHEGEFRRLFSFLKENSQYKSKLDWARAAASRSHAVVLLKGPDTVIAAPDGRAVICANAPQWLATAGSGDVLSGVIGAMLAQGVLAFEAACIGAWIHGEAGREAGPGLIAEDLPEVFPAVYRRLYDYLAIDY